MKKFTAPPNVELAGFMAMTFIHNLQNKDTLPIFEKYGFSDIDPNKWYSASQLMDAMNEMVATGKNYSSAFVAIGMEIGKTLPMPPELANPTLGDVLTLVWDMGYKSVHRNHDGNIGSIQTEKINDKHYTTIHDHLYPDDFSYGIAYGFAKRFLPEGTHFTVYYDSELPQRDMDDADTTVLHIKWE
ncbi:MAG TPA: hypothetical protein PLZ51_22870 [Aggregatilineales bacterium]|nr:hypothetical protein [Aggregatilineales bacterium]